MSGIGSRILLRPPAGGDGGSDQTLGGESLADPSVAEEEVGGRYTFPPDWSGKGNRENPIHPYGSRIFIPGAKGFKTPEGAVLDGLFCIADMGPRIRGLFRFDIFICNASNYSKLREQGITKWKGDVEVENLPSPPRGLDDRNQLGLGRILE